MGASRVLLCCVVLIQLFAGQTDAQRSSSPWQTLSGDAPLVIARGGFSGLFPDSSFNAYSFAKQTSVAGAALWCDVQLTKDGAGICFPDLKLNNASTVEDVYPNRQKTYPVNGVSTQVCGASHHHRKNSSSALVLPRLLRLIFQLILVAPILP
ncbi:hypothetical protein F2Q70_00044908 [Brassica cretica]|uniref:glycerophosphodiester phosphodiesterase n=1 Tax=Brassica cretica TaxID=69181 RepID=A0A8S9KG83_BRACR|nr:hypothetical protein F2Q70_00044908 [Brassica cretica]